MASTLKSYSIGKVRVTQKAQSSYSNIREALASAKSGKGSAKSTAPKAPATIEKAPIPTPQAAPIAQTQATKADKAQDSAPYYATGGWQRVAAVLNPFNWDRIYLTNPFTGNIKADVSAIKIPIVAGEAALVAAGGMAAYQAIGAATGAAAGAGVAAKTAGAGIAAGGLKTALIGGAAGLTAGMLLAGRGSATGAQTSSQAANPNQAVNPSQISNLNDYSNKNSFIRNTQDYRIQDSPGASIYGSQAAAPNLSSAFNPAQAATGNQPTELTSGQQAQAGGDMLIPALILGAAFLFSRR